MNASGDTALSEAALSGDHACVQTLAEEGADVNRALLRVTQSVNDSCIAVEKLLSLGADVNTREWTHQTPLIQASRLGHVNTVNVLLHAGADVNIKDHNERTALIFASETCDSCVELLVHAGADVNAVDDRGISALLSAAFMGIHCTEILINAGADVNIADRRDKPLLSLMCALGKVQYVKLFLDAGADVNKLDPGGVTALMHSVQSGYQHVSHPNMELCPFTECTRLLLRAGAKVNFPGAEDQLVVLHQRHRGAEHRNTAAKLLYAAGERANGEFTTRHGFYNPDQVHLKHLCREAIRNHLLQLDPHKHLFGRVPRLGLPAILTKYLLYGMSLDDD